MGTSADCSLGLEKQQPGNKVCKPVKYAVGSVIPVTLVMRLDPWSHSSLPLVHGPGTQMFGGG